MLVYQRAHFQVWMISISSDPPRHGQAVGPSVVLGLRLPVDIHCQVACLDIMVSTRPTCRLTRVAWCVAAAFLSYKTVPQVYPHQIPVLEIRPHKMLHALQIKSSQKYGRNIKTMCSRQLIELGIVQSCCQTQPPRCQGNWSPADCGNVNGLVFSGNFEAESPMIWGRSLIFSGFWFLISPETNPFMVGAVPDIRAAFAEDQPLPPFGRNHGGWGRWKRIPQSAIGNISPFLYRLQAGGFPC